MILWASGLKVSGAWTIATETPAGGIKKGNYVQGTVLLVLRKRLHAENAFLDELYPVVEDEVKRQIDTMRALDDASDPNFGDTDYQLAAYAAALRVLTQYQTLDGQDVSYELFRAVPERPRGKGRSKADLPPKPRFEQVIDRAIAIACDYLVPRGLEDVWKRLNPDERLYLRALDVESRGERRQGVYQELARGFGVREVKPILASGTANQTRIKTASEFGNRDLGPLGADGFGGSVLRQLLFAIQASVRDENPGAGLRYLKTELPDYWQSAQRLISILDWLAPLGQIVGMEDWKEDTESARLLARPAARGPRMITRHSSRSKALGTDVLRARLTGASSYDRIAGYFRSSLFEIAGEELDAVSGPIRIVCNSDLDARDVMTAQAAQQAMRSSWCRGEPEKLPAAAQPRIEALYRFLSSGRLQVKVLPDEVFGLIHGKAGLIRYPDGRATAFLGSVNESATAWKLNYELLWEDDSPDAVSWVAREFDALWHDKRAVDLACCPFVCADLGRLARRKVIAIKAWKEEPEPSVVAVESPVYRREQGLWPHQKYFIRLAIERHRRASARLVLADQVGLGKTVQLAMAAPPHGPRRPRADPDSGSQGSTRAVAGRNAGPIEDAIGALVGKRMDRRERS